MSPSAAGPERALVEEFRAKHRTGLVTLLFTDIVGSMKIKQVLGDGPGVALVQQHHAALRAFLSGFPDAEVIDSTGDSFFVVFARPSDAVRFALRWEAQLRAQAKQNTQPLLDRIGIHIGEVVVEHAEGYSKRLSGGQVDTCARIMSLAGPDQILLSRAAFDSARQTLKGDEIETLGELAWVSHGSYCLKGLEEPLEICEVGERALGCLTPPADAEKAQRHVSPDAEPVLGWRPALEQRVPGTKWALEKKLGEGGFGEVWLGRHDTLKDRRVFKFCFRADRVRSLKREVTLFRVLKERVGHHPHIVGIQEVFFEQPPFYIAMDYAQGQDLRAWCEAQGGVEKIPVAIRLEIVAQVADALQAAHAAGVIHRDVKPSNILVSQPSTLNSQPTAKLTDFGIGQVVSQEALAGMTRMGFTQTMVGPGSSSHTGTQMYMAPELIAGQPASPQSDIYSLGIVLYELLVGDLGKPLITDWARKIDDSLLREDLEKCFAGDPKERFTNAGQLADNLRRLPRRREELAVRQKSASRRKLVSRIAVTLGAVAAVLFLSRYSFKQGQAPSSRHATTEVMSTNPTALEFYYRGQKRMELINSTNLEMATNLLTRAKDLDPNFSEAYAELANAYSLYDYYYPRDAAQSKECEAVVETALKMNPRSGKAHLANGRFLWRPTPTDFPHEAAIRELRTALELDPALDGAHEHLAVIYDHIGLIDLALSEADKAFQINPRNNRPLVRRAIALSRLGKFQDALKVLNSIPLETEARNIARNSAWFLFEVGDTKKAEELVQTNLHNTGDVGGAFSAIKAMCLAAQGKELAATNLIEKVWQQNSKLPEFHHTAYYLASAYALLNRPEKAVSLLREVAETGFPCYPLFRNDPSLDKITNSVEFTNFLAEQKQTNDYYRTFVKKLDQKRHE